jgi:hypothetical protein
MNSWLSYGSWTFGQLWYAIKTAVILNTGDMCIWFKPFVQIKNWDVIGIRVLSRPSVISVVLYLSFIEHTCSNPHTYYLLYLFLQSSSLRPYFMPYRSFVEISALQMFHMELEYISVAFGMRINSKNCNFISFHSNLYWSTVNISHHVPN